MMQAYLAGGMADTATFTLFVRRLPQNRNFLVACGLAQVLAHLEELHFADGDLDYLRSLDRFSETFLTSLRDFRFTGDVYAVPEGTPVFANEPIVEVVAPIAEGQLVETFVMNQIHAQTVLASKAVRVVMAARGRPIVDFGARRAHGTDAATAGARAFYIAGVSATSNVLAGKMYGIPVAGTMAHSYIQAHADEREAFRTFVETFPGTTVLVDTYDTVEGVRRLIELIDKAPSTMKVGAIRLDSGDLAALARETRALLDAAGLHDVDIFASSDLDEREIAALVSAGAPVDGFGVGTGMSVPADAPSLDIVYKLAEYGGRGRTKLSYAKPSLPGRKQVFREYRDGRAVGDVIGRADERLAGRPLLQLVMRAGRRVPAAAPDLGAVRRYAAEEFAQLAEPVTDLEPAEPPYPIKVSPALEAYHSQVRTAAAAWTSSRRS